MELQLDMLSLVSDELATEIKRVFGEEFKRLSRDEQLVVVGAMQADGLSNQDLQPILEVNSLDVRKLLHALVGKGFLTVNPNGRWTTYSINRNFNVGENVGEDSLTPRRQKILTALKESKHPSF